MLARYWQGRITLRQLRVLVQHLPPGGARQRALKGDHWTDETALLAVIGDRLGDLTSITEAARTRKAPKRVEPLARPGKPSGPAPVGHVDAGDELAAIDFLQSLRPPSS